MLTSSRGQVGQPPYLVLEAKAQAIRRKNVGTCWAQLGRTGGLSRSARCPRRLPRAGADVAALRVTRDANLAHDARPRRSAAHVRSGGLPTTSPPAKKTTARKDQARQSCTSDGTGDPAHAATRDSVVETEPQSPSGAHRFIKCNLDSVMTSRQRDADQVV